MLVRFATTLAFLLFGCSSPNGVVAANNIADVVGGVQEDHGIDDFARKVNSPTAAAAAAGGASASHGEVMGHQQHPRVLKEGKGNHRQAMKNDEGHRSLGLFDSKSTKVAPGEMDLQLTLWAAQRALQSGDYVKALEYALKMVEVDDGNLEARNFTFHAALAGVLYTHAHRFYTTLSTDDEGDDGKAAFKEMELEVISRNLRKVLKPVAKTLDRAIANTSDGLEKIPYLQVLGDLNNAVFIQGRVLAQPLSDQRLSIALENAKGSYKLAYETCIQSDSLSLQPSGCYDVGARYAYFLKTVLKEDEKANQIITTELSKIDTIYGVILLEGWMRANLQKLLGAGAIAVTPVKDNLKQVVDVATCNHYATSTAHPPCDVSCNAWPYDTDSLEQDEGEKECCGMAYILACAMAEEIKEDIGSNHDIEVQVALNNALNDGEIDSTSVSELHMKVVTYYADNTFVPDQVEAPPSEEAIREIASNAIESIASSVHITLEDDYVYEFSVCQASPFHSNTMVVSLGGTSSLIDSARIYFVIPGANGGGANETPFARVGQIAEIVALGHRLTTSADDLRAVPTFGVYPPLNNLVRYGFVSNSGAEVFRAAAGLSPGAQILIGSDADSMSSGGYSRTIALIHFLDYVLSNETLSASPGVKRLLMFGSELSGEVEELQQLAIGLTLQTRMILGGLLHAVGPIS